MKIKHLLLIPIIGYLIYLMHHAFTVSFVLDENKQTTFDAFANTITGVIIILLLVLSPFIIMYLKENTTIFKRINKFLNHKIL